MGRDDAHLDRHRLPERHADREAARGRRGRLRRRRDLRAGPGVLSGQPRGDRRARRAAGADAWTSTSRSAMPRACTRRLFAAVLHRANAKFRLMQQLGIDTILVCSNVGHRHRRRRRGLRRPAAPARRRGRGVRRPGGVRGAGLGAVRRRLPARLADRRAGRPPGRRRLPRQLPHPVPRPRPGRHRGHPGREDLLPPARGRARADHGRAVVEPAPPAVPRRGRLRPGRPSWATCSRAGYAGPLSLEVFNDTFRQTDVLRTAQQARRSLIWLEDQVARGSDCVDRTTTRRPDCPTSDAPRPSTSSR